jgi:hypothetical protein
MVGRIFGRYIHFTNHLCSPWQSSEYHNSETGAIGVGADSVQNDTRADHLKQDCEHD